MLGKQTIFAVVATTDMPHELLENVMARRNVHSVIAVPVGLEHPSVTTRDVTTDLLGDGLNPFLLVSLFDMTGPAFPPHPHAGFTVATYIFPESESAFLNQDSTGFQNRIAVGGIHATVAGTGVLHEETNETNGRSALGLQIWLNMSAAQKMQPPRPISLEPADVPIISRNGANIRVLIGASNGLTSPMVLPTPVRIVDVTLASGQSFSQELALAEQAFALMISGTASIRGDDTTSIARGLEAVRFDTDGDELSMEAGQEGARFVIFAGEPIHEPVVLAGPFVGSSQQQIDRFLADFQSGRMGTLKPFAQSRAD